MIKLTFIQILFYFRSCRPCHPHWRSADAVLFFSFLSPQDCGDLQPTAPRWDGRRVPALRRSRRGRWSRLTLCCLISSSGEVDQTDRRGYHRGPAAHRGGCGHRGHVRVPSSRDWTRSPPVALPSYPPADWLLCFWSNRIFPAASGTVGVNVVFLRRPWLALFSLPCFIVDTRLPFPLYLFAFLLLLFFLLTFFCVVLYFSFLLLWLWCSSLYCIRSISIHIHP